MNSEKVKDIKDKLQEEIFIANSFGNKLRKVPTKELENLLTLINELESENEKLRLERDVLIGKKIVEKQKYDNALIVKIDIQKQLKNRIAELEKKIENGTLVEFNKPFYSNQLNAWCIYLREGDYITSLCLTKEQAEEYQKELQEEQK